MQWDSRVANAGNAAGFDYQPETQRIKGSLPELDGAAESAGFLERVVLPLLRHHSQASRLSLRVFCTPGGEQKLSENLPPVWNGFLMEKEVSIALKPGLHWVWIGGNLPGRTTGSGILSPLIRQHHSCGTIDPGTSGAYQLVQLTSSSVVQERSGVPVHQISGEQASALARLYASRIPVNITPNHDAEYIRKALAGSPESELYVLLDPHSGMPRAAIVNEYTRYPVSGLPRVTSLLIGESNDWIKAPEVPRSAFVYLIREAVRCALNRGASLVEAECLPQALSVAAASGLRPAGLPLLRTTKMHTDIPGPERNDPAADPRYRKFVSLFLYYTLPAIKPLTHETAATPISS